MSNQITYELTGNFQYDIGVFGLKLALDTLRKKGVNINYTYDAFSLTVNASTDDIVRLLLLSLLELDRNKNNNKNDKNDNDAQKIAKTLNNHLLNFYNPGKLKKLASLEDLIRDIYADFHEKAQNHTCSFCNHEKPSVPINRMYFLCAPSPMNSFYNNDPSIFICKDCLIPMLASPLVLDNTSTLVYVPNLKSMQAWYKIRDKQEINIFNEIVKRLIRENHHHAQIVEYKQDKKRPSIDIFSIGKQAIEKMKTKTVSDVLEKLIDERTIFYINTGSKGKSIKVNVLRDTIFYIATHQSLFTLIQFHIRYVFQMFKNDDQFYRQYAKVLLLILKIHVLLKTKEVKSMEALNEIFEQAKKYGEDIHGYIWSNKEPNTAINYSISLASALIQSVNLPFTQALETLIRISITTGKPIPFEIRANINKENYKEVLTAIALSIMSFSKPKEEKTEEEGEQQETESKEEVVKQD